MTCEAKFRSPKNGFEYRTSKRNLCGASVRGICWLCAFCASQLLTELVLLNPVCPQCLTVQLPERLAPVPFSVLFSLMDSFVTCNPFFYSHFLFTLNSCFLYAQKQLCTYPRRQSGLELTVVHNRLDTRVCFVLLYVGCAYSRLCETV